jgi:GNAT superfamily N-acetyltransferase
MLALHEVQDAPDEAQAWQLIREYLGWLDSCLQQEYQLHLDVDNMIVEDKAEAEKYGRPHGRFYLALANGEVAGVGRLKKLDDEIAELKRMYVPPDFRGLGIGRFLLNQLIADARTIGYQKLRLDSLRFLTAAYHCTHPSASTRLTPIPDKTPNYTQVKTTPTPAILSTSSWKWIGPELRGCGRGG